MKGQAEELAAAVAQTAAEKTGTGETTAAESMVAESMVEAGLGETSAAAVDRTAMVQAAAERTRGMLPRRPRARCRTPAPHQWSSRWHCLLVKKSSKKQLQLTATLKGKLPANLLGSGKRCVHGHSAVSTHRVATLAQLPPNLVSICASLGGCDVTPLRQTNCFYESGHAS